MCLLEVFIIVVLLVGLVIIVMEELFRVLFVLELFMIMLMFIGIDLMVVVLLG